jgi:hypothetical protein
MMIGGIEVFLPNNQVKVNAHDEGASNTKTSIRNCHEEEMGQTLGFDPAEEKEYSKNGSKFSVRMLK